MLRNNLGLLSRDDRCLYGYGACASRWHDHRALSLRVRALVHEYVMWPRLYMGCMNAGVDLADVIRVNLPRAMDFARFCVYQLKDVLGSVWA